jgi:hypothetical protein
MKKVFVIVMICVLCAPLFTQERDKTSGSGTPSPEITALQTAYNLAKYGYSNYSASALIGAAEILVKIQTQPLGAKPDKGQGGATSGTKAEPPEFTPVKLLADAKRFAAGDATMLAWADKVEKSLAASSTRGAAGGPKQGLETVAALGRVSYIIPFTAGQLAQVYVSGDGTTDLDLFIYDSNGNLVTYDDDYGDECLARWIPARTGQFTIVVKNLGRVWNRYYIMTN